MCNQMWKQRSSYAQCHMQFKFFGAEQVTYKKIVYVCLCTEEQLSMGKSP